MEAPLSAFFGCAYDEDVYKRQLTGHEEAIAETARLTNEWHEPDEDKKRELDEKMNELMMLYRKRN